MGNLIASGGLKRQYIAIIATFLVVAYCFYAVIIRILQIAILMQLDVVYKAHSHRPTARQRALTYSAVLIKHM